MRSGHPIEQEDLMAYLDGELSPDRAGSAAAHLDECRECQGVAADLQGVSRRMLAWQVEEVAGDVTAPVRVALNQQPQEKARIRRTPRWLWWGFASAATVLAVLIVFPVRTKTLAPPVASKNQKMSYFEAPAPAGRAFEANTNMSAAPIIIHAAQIVLITGDFDKARIGVDEILKRYKGFAGELEVTTPPGAGRTLKASLRIPVDQREAARADVKKLGRVETESQTGEDITETYRDLDVRLSNAKNTEVRLTEMLRARTGKLADVLAVELEIDRVRGEIEQMEASKKNLTNRVEFATLNVRITEEYKASAQVDSGSTLARFRNAAIAGYRNVLDVAAAVVEFLLSYGPILLLSAAILFFPARFGWRRWRQR